MRHFALGLAVLPAMASAQIAPERVAQMRDAALKDQLAWDIAEGLTTEVGQRLAGTEAEARARAWAVVKLQSLGFANVRVEPFDMPVWVRGEETAEVVAPFPQKLVLTALGNSGATPPGGLVAQLVGFQSLAALRDAPESAVRGKIVFVTHRMKPAQDGSPYDTIGDIRRAGPSVAAAKGAAAILIRSIGTDYHRNPHTGAQSWAKGVKPIPAAALSVPDSEQVERILARGKTVTMKLVLTPRNLGTRRSGNVIAEVPGRDQSLGMILIGGHLDSWDLGTGAVDDAAGVAITAAAAKRVMDSGQPLRNIRLVWFGAEEVGLLGGIAYADAHRQEKHALLAESDFGADRVWRYRTRVSDAALPAIAPLAEALARLGIVAGGNGEAEGSDISVLAATGVPVVELSQDGTRYFDLHHTADDTLDKIDPVQLRQNVAAWTTLLAITANSKDDFGPVAPSGQ